MCGIFGHIGPHAREYALEGLQRMEYRGYDSSGIAYTVQNQLQIYKQKGKLKEMIKLLPCEENSVPVRTIIGHTRWATHGIPSAKNAHPIASGSGSYAVVHNGIIENHTKIKEDLVREGVAFHTDTDTEVIVNFIEKEANKLAEGEPWITAVRRALAFLEGAFSIAVLCAERPDEFIAVRNGSSLIIGIDEKTGDKSIASDISAFPISTTQLIYLEDGDVAIFSRDKFSICNLQGETINRTPEACSVKEWRAGKEGFPHYMLKEIIEQPKTIVDTLEAICLASSKEDWQNLWRSLEKTNRIVLCACGTSWHAAQIGKHYIESMAKRPVEVAYASEFRYRDPLVGRDDTVILISQSGETADTLAAMREAQRKGSFTLCICNVDKASLARECQHTIYTRTGIEVGVASTKAFTAQIVALYFLAVKMAEQCLEISKETTAKALQSVRDMASLMTDLINRRDDVMHIAQQLKHVHNFLYLGRGVHFPVALEGALKLKEISYIHAEGYPAAEMKHGPIALVDETMPALFIAIKDELYPKILSNIEEIKARKGKVIAVAEDGDEDIASRVDFVLRIPKSPNKNLSPLLEVVPLQFLSYYIAVLLDRDVDQPRNLAKSVTVE